MPEVNFNASEQTSSEQPIGTSDYDKAMIEVAEGNTPEVQSQEEQSTEQSDRPEWLQDKFKTPEDMAKAYSELEKKLGQASEETKEETQEQTTEESGETETEEKSEGSLDFDKYTQEVLNDGKLSEGSYEELTKLGIPREVVDAYVSQQAAQVTEVQTKFFETVGGEENYGKVAEWANGNIDQSKLDAYNQALNDNNVGAATSMLNDFYNEFKTATGYEGEPVSNAQSAKPGVDEFANWEQVQEAMMNPKFRSDRYRDPAYVAEVEAKIARSKRLN